jgi:hypothetical protein
LKWTPITAASKAVGHKGCCVWPRDDSTRKTLTVIGLRVLIDAYLVIAEIENELKCPAWENPLPQNRRLEAVINPEVLDEIGEWGDGLYERNSMARCRSYEVAARSGPPGNAASLKAQDNMSTPP